MMPRSSIKWHPVQRRRLANKLKGTPQVQISNADLELQRVRVREQEFHNTTAIERALVFITSFGRAAGFH